MLTTTSLLESKKLELVRMDYRHARSLNNIHIDTERLELEGVFLEEILMAEHISTKSLVLEYFYEDFADSLLTMDVGFVII